MKKIALLFALSFAFLACETENETINNQDLSFEVASQENNIGIYKGVFTTLDSENRATVSIMVTDATTFAATYGNRAIATLTFNDGTIQKATANRSIELGEEIQNLEFQSNNIAFKFSVNSDGSNPIITDAIFNNKASDIAILKHSSKTPITPITGTYICTDCMDHPSLNNGNAQTFNMMLTNTTDNTGSTLNVQSVAGGNTFSGTGTQDPGADNTDGTFDATFSGTITSVNNTIVTFNGIHTYGGFNMGDPECSGVDGTWDWVTTNFGTITGSFISDDSCVQGPVVVAIEDFDNTTPTWNAIANPTFFEVGTDSFTPTDGSASGANNITNPTFTNDFLFIRDLANNNGGTAVGEFATLTFENISIDATDIATITFDYDVIGFDAGDDVEYIVVLDGINQTPVLFVEGVNNGGTTVQGTGTINIPVGTTSVGFILLVKQNGASDYAGFDNFTLTVE